MNSCPAFILFAVVSTTSWVLAFVAIVLTILLIISIGFGLRSSSAVQARLKSKLDERDELLDYARESEKKIRDELSVLQKSMSDLLGRVSHEIRTPMNGVLGMTGMLAGTSLSTEQDKYVHGITNSGNALLQSINEIMTTFSTLVPIDDSNPTLAANSALIQKQFNAHSQNAHILSTEFASHYPLRIAIAEDNIINQEVVVMILTRLGYDPLMAANGKELLEKASEKNYDLIFMDVQMPEMDGLEATRMIRLCFNVQPVIIAMTANVMSGNREECLRAGMDDYISKPLNFEELQRVLEKWANHIRQKQRT